VSINTPRSALPRLALARLPAPPPPGSIQFFDGYFPALPAGSYTIDITQEQVEGPGSIPPYNVKQRVVVQAPEFVIDPGIIQTIYPPNGSSDSYSQELPFIVLTDPSLPWERSLIPGDDQPNSASSVPWMALLIFAEGEIQLQPGSSNPVLTVKVEDLVAHNANVLKPQFPDHWLSPAALASQCQTITITGEAFRALMPQTTELPYLAHCRAVRSATEGEALLAVILCNRLAVGDTRKSPQAPLRYYAHLVSLEGFAAYLGPNGQPIPKKPGGGMVDVQMVSLAHWTFVSLPQTGLSFEKLVQGLIDSEQETPALRLPVSGTPPVPQAVLDRLHDGYAPLTFVAGSGDESFAWYRGPFTPEVPQPLPEVGNPPVCARHATTADALMIYLAEEGLFDLSYAAAWNIGRELALADAGFAQSINTYRQAANAALTRLSQRLALPHFSAKSDPGQLAARDATRAHFSRLVGDGLGRKWTSTLESVRAGVRPQAQRAYRLSPLARRGTIHPREALAIPGAAQAITENVQEVLDSIAAWLAKLSLLYPIPFSHLVPDPRMLPVESIRFFYVDQGWIDATVAGALSIGIHGSADVALLSAVRPHLDHAIATHRGRLSRGPTGAVSTSGGGTKLTGMLIRSQLVSGWPSLAVRPTLGGASLPMIRNDCPSPTVRLCLFHGVPDRVSLCEPYHGLQFGVESDGIAPRCVTAPSQAGVQIVNVQKVRPETRPATSGAIGGVLQVQSVATALEIAVGVTSFGEGAVVKWNGAPLQTTKLNDKQVNAVVPASLVASPGTAEVTVVVGGVSSRPATFTIDHPLAIDEIRPVATGEGGPAFTLTVNGVGFGEQAVVQWNDTNLQTKVISRMELTAQVPASLITKAGAASITVTSAGATSNPQTLLVVGPKPEISAIMPNVQPAGAGGFTLKVTGSGFTPDSIVRWNGSPLVTTILSTEQVSAAVSKPLIAKIGKVQVTVENTLQKVSSNTVEFSIAGPNPTIGVLQPSVALAGQSGFGLTVDGVNFAPDSKVHWNKTALDTKFHDAEQLTATVPAGLVTVAGLDPVRVTVVTGHVTSNEMPFTVIAPQPTIGLLEPGVVVAGNADFTLRVTGGFGAGDFALQLVRAPERQSFPSDQTRYPA
jgi:hypothetical protein